MHGVEGHSFPFLFPVHFQPKGYQTHRAAVTAALLFQKQTKTGLCFKRFFKLPLLVSLLSACLYMYAYVHSF